MGTKQCRKCHAVISKNVNFNSEMTPDVKNWFSERSGECINLHEISKEDLINELVHLQKEYNKVFVECKKLNEDKRHIIEDILRTAGIFGIDVFDEKTEKKKLEKFFEVLFC